MSMHLDSLGLRMLVGADHFERVPRPNVDFNSHVHSRPKLAPALGSSTGPVAPMTTENDAPTENVLESGDESTLPLSAHEHVRSAKPYAILLLHPPHRLLGAKPGI